MHEITKISIGDRKKIPSVPFTVMKRQWKMELKKLGFLIKAVSSNTGLGLSGLPGLRNGILQLAFSLKKTTHIFAQPPPSATKGTNEEDQRLK